MTNGTLSAKDRTKRLEKNQKILKDLNRFSVPRVKLAQYLGYESTAPVDAWFRRGRISDQKLDDVEKYLNGIKRKGRK